MTQMYTLSPEYREKSLEVRNHTFGTEYDEKDILNQYYQTLLCSPILFNDTAIAGILKKIIPLSNIKTIKILQMILNPQDDDKERLQTLLADLLDEKLAEKIQDNPELFIPAIHILAVLEGEKLGIVQYQITTREYDDYAHEEYLAE